MFGAPEAEEDEAMRKAGFEAGSTRGLVVFHDALYVPNSVVHPTNGPRDDTPFAVDVLTVHQKRYYDGSGADWPCDYDNPNPVGFLSVRPNARFLLVLSGPRD